jgi:hypothetical protein
MVASPINKVTFTWKRLLTWSAPDVDLTEAFLPMLIPRLFTTHPFEYVRKHVELPLRRIVHIEDEDRGFGPLAEERLLRIRS